jgi:hypothetical protein
MKRLSYILGFIILTAFFVSIPLANAAISGEGLTISPPISEPNVKPGQTVTQTIILTNPTNKMIEVYPQTMDFKAGGETGQPAFMEVGDSSGKFSLAKWISFSPSKIALTPEQVVHFSYKISVPSDAEPGGHYGAVFFLSQPPKDTTEGSKVSIGSMVGSLVLVKVPGDIVEKGIIQSFASTEALYVAQKKASFVTKISNTGNIHFKPSGTIEIENMFGTQVGSLMVNSQGGNILPDSTRRFDNNWGLKWYQVGYFTANLHVLYGTGQAPLEATANFWIVPIWLMIVIGFTLLAIILGVIALVAKRRKTHPKKDKPNNSTPTPQGPPILR